MEGESLPLMRQDSNLHSRASAPVSYAYSTVELLINLMNCYQFTKHSEKERTSTATDYGPKEFDFPMLQGLPCGGPVLHQFVPIFVRLQVTILPQNQLDRFLRHIAWAGTWTPVISSFVISNAPAWVSCITGWWSLPQHCKPVHSSHVACVLSWNWTNNVVFRRPFFWSRCYKPVSTSKRGLWDLNPYIQGSVLPIELWEPPYISTVM